AEEFLGGVDVHDGEIASESARQAAGLHDATHNEYQVALHGAHGHAAVDLQAILFREGLGDDQRVRLCQKHQRIVDGLVGAFQIVNTKAAVAQHVHAENQEVSFAGGDGRFNHR